MNKLRIYNRCGFLRTLKIEINGRDYTLTKDKPVEVMLEDGKHQLKIDRTTNVYKVDFVASEQYNSLIIKKRVPDWFMVSLVVLFIISNLVLFLGETQLGAIIPHIVNIAVVITLFSLAIYQFVKGNFKLKYTNHKEKISDDYPIDEF